MYEKKHALPNKKIHTPKGIARLTVTAATMAAMTGSSLISPFTAFAQTGDGGTQHPAVMSPIAAHAGAASGTGAKSAAQTIADLQKAVDEAKAKEDAAKASYDEAAGPYNEAASARDQAKASYDSAVSAGTAADRAAMDEYARQVAEGKDAADAAGKDLEQAKAGLADAKADASEKDEAYQSAIKAAQNWGVITSAMRHSFLFADCLPRSTSWYPIAHARPRAKARGNPGGEPYNGRYSRGSDLPWR